MKRRTTNRRRLTTRSTFSSAAFAHATALVCGQRSVVFPTLFPSLPSVKNPFACRGRRVYGYGKPQVRHGDRTRDARATCTAPRRLNLLAWYRHLVTTAKPHRDQVRAVPSARYAHLIRIGSLASAVDVISIGTTVVRHRGNQRTVAIDVDVTRGRPTPEEVYRLQAVHFVTMRVQRDLHGRRCSCRCWCHGCRRCCCWRHGCRRSRSRRSRWSWRRRGLGRAKDFHRIRWRGRSVAACQPDVAEAVRVSWEVAPRSHERRNWGTCCPGVSAWVVDVHLARGIGGDSTPAHDQHQAVEVKRSRLPCGPRYRCYRAGGIGARVEAERVGGVDQQASLEIRCPTHVDDATYGGCRCIHDPLRRVHHLCPLRAHSSSGIKLPDLIGGGYVDVESAQDV